MAMRVHIGAKELKGDLAAYAKRFDLLEVRNVEAANAPSAATLRKWRRAVPPRFEFAVVAGPNVGRLGKGSAPNDAFEAELKAMLSAATLLEARVLLIPTPPDVTPGKLSRDRLAKVVDRLPRDATSIVWEPSGLWEIEDAAMLAKKLGITVAVDPSRDVVPPGPLAYARLRALGGTRAYSAAALERVVRAIGDHRDVYVVIETTGALKEGKSLRQLFRTAKSRATGGETMLIRPRGAPLRASDDEEDE